MITKVVSFFYNDVLDNLCYFKVKNFLRKILFSKFTLLEMKFITVLYSNSYYCLRNILLLKFTLLGIKLIIVLAHQSYMGACGSCGYGKKVLTVNAKDVVWIQCEHANKPRYIVQLESQIKDLEKVQDINQDKNQLEQLKDSLAKEKNC
jgi:hypothetical protein